MTRRKRELGYCSVTSPDSQWELQRDQFEPVRTAWLKGVRFVDAIGFHGEYLTIRLTDVDSIIDFTPDVVMANVHEQRADMSDDSLAPGAA